jgi:hypothetical protein
MRHLRRRPLRVASGSDQKVIRSLAHKAQIGRIEFCQPLPAQQVDDGRVDLAFLYLAFIVKKECRGKKK